MYYSKPRSLWFQMEIAPSLIQAKLITPCYAPVWMRVEWILVKVTAVDRWCVKSTEDGILKPLPVGDTGVLLLESMVYMQGLVL